MVVLEMDFERTGFWDSVRRRRLLQVDIERRDRPAALAPAERPRHREMTAREPNPFCKIPRRRQRSRRFGEANITGQRHRLVGDEPAHRAILLGPILHGVLHESGVDHDGLSPPPYSRHETPPPATATIPTPT